MTSRKSSMMDVAALTFCLLAGLAFAQTEMKSPARVQTALATLNRVVAHTQRLITAKNYTRLPHENDEFKEGVTALNSAIANEPADFKDKIEPLLSKAQADSHSVADAAVAHGDAKLDSSHALFADSVKAVLAAFPASVQPSAADKKKPDRTINMTVTE
jgi:hypothetical protein